MHGAILSATEPGPLYIPFIFRWVKRGGEVADVSTEAKAESPGVNMREGGRNAAERCRRLTGVSQHSASGPMAEWRLRDKAEAYRPRHAPQGLLLPCRLPPYLAFPLYSCPALLGEHAAMDTIGGMEEVTLLGSSLGIFFFFSHWRLWKCKSVSRSWKNKTNKKPRQI